MCNKMINREETYRNIWNTIFYSYGVDALLTEGENENEHFLSTTYGFNAKFTCKNEDTDHFIFRLFSEIDGNFKIEVNYIDDLTKGLYMVENEWPYSVEDRFLYTISSIYINRNGLIYNVEVIK